MQNKTKNDGTIGGAIAHSARGLTKNGYHRCCKFKEKAIWEEEILMLWIFLSRNASTNTKSFYHNSWEMKFILSTQGASRAALFFSPLNVRECFFFLPICTSRVYSVHVYIFSKINQPPITPPPTPSRLRNRPPDKPWHATCAPRSSHW